MIKRATTIVLASAVILCGCGKDDQLSRKSTGKTITFSVPDDGTRTVYSGDPSDGKQKVNWEQNDQIKIFCEEAENLKNAAYTVKRNNTDRRMGTLQPSNNTAVLQWGSDDGIHNFYGVYPSDVATVTPEGIASFPAPLQQVGTVTSSISWLSGRFMAEHDMDLCYMAAKTSTAPVENVSMTFKPIMTTLKIVVKAEESGGVIFFPDGSLRVYAISVIKENARESYAGTMQFDANDFSLVESGAIVSQEYKVSLLDKRLGNNNNYIDLRSSWLSGFLGTGQELMFTVYLPPFDISASDPVKIRLYYADDTTHYVDMPLNRDIPGGDIAEVLLPRFPQELIQN